MLYMEALCADRRLLMRISTATWPASGTESSYVKQDSQTSPEEPSPLQSCWQGTKAIVVNGISLFTIRYSEEQSFCKYCIVVYVTACGVC